MESLCLKKLKDIGGTGNARELSQALEQPMENISPRLNALALAGLIRDTGRRDSVGRGRPLVIWTVTDLGWDTFSGKSTFADIRKAIAPKPVQTELL